MDADSSSSNVVACTIRATHTKNGLTMRLRSAEFPLEETGQTKASWLREQTCTCFRQSASAKPIIPPTQMRGRQKRLGIATSKLTTAAWKKEKVGAR
jgi:hypothetical protein